MLEGIDKLVRPLITLSLSAVLCIVIISGAFGLISDWKDVLAALMATLGPIIGFWFGERSALKVPGKDETV